jgi:hypothetical protein
MESRSSDSSISRTLHPLGGLFEPPFGHLPTLQAHSSSLAIARLGIGLGQKHGAIDHAVCAEQLMDGEKTNYSDSCRHLITLKGCSTLARMLALILSNLSIKGSTSTVLLFFKARRLPGIMATC